MDHFLEKEMATHSSILGLENPRDREAWWAMGSHRVGHDWSDLAAAVYRRPFFSACSPTFIICGLFDDSHFERYGVISHCGFDLHLSDVEHLFFMCFLVICMSSLGKCLFRSSVQFSNQVLCSFWYWIIWTIYVFWISSSHWSFHLQVFSNFQ